MKKEQSTLIYSPSDLVLFMRSPFASWLERKLIEDPDSLRDQMDRDPMNALLGEMGDAHEAGFLQYFQEKHGVEHVACIERNYKTAASNTIQAMKDGYDVIFQAYLERDEFRGFADFLVKVPGQSELGDYHYEAWDTKLAKSTRPYFVVQLCTYSWMLEKLQGRLPDEIVIVLGDRTEDRMRIAGHMAYFHELKKEFLAVQHAFSGNEEQMPDPTFTSDYGRWGSYAKAWMETSDSLSVIANIRKSQIQKLHAADIKTLQGLAETSLESVRGMPTATFNKLKAQASIQFRSRGLDVPLYEVVEPQPNKGLPALPPESPLDVYFDIEGHPLMEGGLEYLWGCSVKDADAPRGKTHGFLDWWAHDREQEKAAFEGFIDWVHARWVQDPSMHVYHYASYEVTAINKISSREQSRMDQVAELLANGVFVDLYRIVLNGIRIGEPKYSIKNVEHLYNFGHYGDVANGGESVVVYERWRESGGDGLWRDSGQGHKAWINDPEGFHWDAWPELMSIRDYNIDDCESTLELGNWLRGIQSDNQILFLPPNNDLLIEVERTESKEANTARRSALQARQQALIDRQKEDPELKDDPDAEFLVSLLQFHARERKPKAFEYYQRLQKSDEELIDDDSILHGLTIMQSAVIDGKLECHARFESDQPLRKDRFGTAVIWNTNVSVSKVKFLDLDDHTGVIRFSLDPIYEEALNQDRLHLLAGGNFIPTEGLEVSLCELTEAYFETGELSPHIASLIHRDAPNLDPVSLPITRANHPDDDDYLAAIKNAVHAMQGTVLSFQGPPGAGKTYTANKVIQSLVASGFRVGVMSNSHAAIMNLLTPLADEIPEFLMAKIDKFRAENGETDREFRTVFPIDKYRNFKFRGKMEFTRAEPYEDFKVIGATAFQFVKMANHHSKLDYLFVDEASQVPLANLIAVAPVAKNILLVGDQMQLEQPTQGVHPDQSGISALDYILGDEAVIPENKGIFLERTYRMHPSICHPVSELVYQGKLGSDPSNQNQSVVTTKPGVIRKSSGIQTLWIPHEGNTQSSREEADVIVKLIQELEGATVTRKDGSTKILDHKDILVVAPYNMQVNLLKEHLKDKLPDTLGVGTIDKFQGQEAPVVIVSMTVSNIEESPRGLDFVFDKNRLNVAISRAKALVLLVASPRLLSSPVNSIDQMEKVGTFIRFANEGA